VLAIVGPALLYVLAVQLAGLYLASAAYIALFMRLLGKYSRVRSLLVALAVTDLGALLHGFSVILTPMNLALMLVGIVLGVLIGVLPGLGCANRALASCA
jgi:hypothetical protein